MTAIRLILSIILFFAGVAAIIAQLYNGFSWVYTIGAIVCLLLAYFIYPKDELHRRYDDIWWLDVLELFIQYPLSLIFRLFRGLLDIF